MTTTTQPTTTVDLDGTDTAQWFAALRQADEQIAMWTGIRGRAIEHLQQAMGDATEARLNGQQVITWIPQRPSMLLDRKALEAEFGKDTIAAFLKPSAAKRPFKVIAPQDGA